jgi:hypothetical protein
MKLEISGKNLELINIEPSSNITISKKLSENTINLSGNWENKDTSLVIQQRDNGYSFSFYQKSSKKKFDYDSINFLCTLDYDICLGFDTNKYFVFSISIGTFIEQDPAIDFIDIKFSDKLLSNGIDGINQDNKFFKK